MALSAEQRKEYNDRYYAKNREAIIAKQLAKQKKKYAENPEYFRQAAARRTPEQKRRWAKNSWVRRRFGIEASEYDAKLATQNYICEICKDPLANGNHALDHDHSTGKLRDFLCKRCNAAIGWFGDNFELLRSAADYLERHK